MSHLIDLVETNLFLGLLPTDYGNISGRLITYIICDIKEVNHIINRWYSLHISSNILWIYDPWWFMAMHAIYLTSFVFPILEPVSEVNVLKSQHKLELFCLQQIVRAFRHSPYLFWFKMSGKILSYFCFQILNRISNDFLNKNLWVVQYQKKDNTRTV